MEGPAFASERGHAIGWCITSFDQYPAVVVDALEHSLECQIRRGKDGREARSRSRDRPPNIDFPARLVVAYYSGAIVETSFCYENRDFGHFLASAAQLDSPEFQQLDEGVFRLKNVC
jgi:hypothetical protein